MKICDIRFYIIREKKEHLKTLNYQTCKDILILYIYIYKKTKQKQQIEGYIHSYTSRDLIYNLMSIEILLEKNWSIAMAVRKLCNSSFLFVKFNRKSKGSNYSVFIWIRVYIKGLESKEIV